MDEQELREALRLMSEDIPDLAAVRADVAAARIARSRRVLWAMASGAFTVFAVIVIAILVGRADRGNAVTPVTIVPDAATERVSQVESGNDSSSGAVQPSFVPQTQSATSRETVGASDKPSSEASSSTKRVTSSPTFQSSTTIVVTTSAFAIVDPGQELTTVG